MKYSIQLMKTRILKIKNQLALRRRADFYYGVG